MRTPPQPGMYMPGSMVKTAPSQEGVARPGADAWVFVDGEADAVAEAVAELVAVAGLLDDAAGEAVRLLAGHLCFDGGGGGHLCAEDRVVDGAEGLIGPADADGAGDVAAVAPGTLRRSP